MEMKFPNAPYRAIHTLRGKMTKPGALDIAARLLWLFLVSCAAIYLLSYVTIALVRIPYPFELEWTEGGMVDHVRQILAGRKIYAAPSLSFTAYIHPPFYFYVSALVSQIVGTSFFSLRLVSFLASLGCFHIIYRLVRQETGQRAHGLLASGLFAATFSSSGAWGDLARVDMLFLFLLLAAVYLVRFARTDGAFALAGLFAALAFLTSQTTLLIVLPLMVYLIISDRRAFIAFSVPAAGVAAVSSIALDVMHDGWYSYYLYELPSRHALVKSQLLDFWTRDLFLPLGIASSMAFLYFAFLLSQPRGKDFAFYLLLSVGMLAGAWVSTLYARGPEHVLLPAYALLSILFALGLHRVTTLLRTQTGSDRIIINRNRAITTAVYLACIVQFAVLVYDPRNQVPSREDVAAGQRLLSIMRSIDGEILTPHHGYLPALAGKNTHAHEMAIRDVLRAGSGPVQKQLSTEINEAIVQGEFAAIMIDEPWNLGKINQRYDHAGPVFQSNRDFWPVAGTRYRPSDLYVLEVR